MKKSEAKETNRTWTMDDSKTIALPQEIKDAVLNGYDVYITKSVRDGVVSAKITFHKVRVAGMERLSVQKP